MIDIIYAALPMRAQTEKMTFSCKDDCTYIDKAHTALDIFRFAVLFLISLLGAIAIAVGVVAYIEGVPPVSLG